MQTLKKFALSFFGTQSEIVMMQAEKRPGTSRERILPGSLWHPYLWPNFT